MNNQRPGSNTDFARFAVFVGAALALLLFVMVAARWAA